MKERKFSTQVLAEVAIFAALAFVLDVLQGGIWRGVWVSGGSIGIAMIPILIICFRRGFVPGLLCGTIVGVIQLAGGVYAISDTWYNIFIQILLDYVLAYPVVAAAGLFYKPFQNAKTPGNRLKWISIGCVVGGLLKLLCHFLAGVIFWADMGSSFLGIIDSNSIVYSLVYNGTFMIPNIILAVLIIGLIDLKQPIILSLTKKEDKGELANE